MELAVNETKIQAKRLLKTLKSKQALLVKHPLLKKMGVTNPEELKLKHTLALIAVQLGFAHWQQASAVLSGHGQTHSPVNMGTLFYPVAGHGLTNEWFADYKSAQLVFNKHKNKWLFPYKNQFIVVDRNYLNAFNFSDEITSKFHQIDNDMHGSYNSHLWDEITCAVIKNRMVL